MAARVQRTESHVRRTKRLADEARVAVLRDLHVCATLPVSELRWIGRHAVVRVFAAQTTIVTERMSSDFVYLVLKGTMRATLHDRVGREVSIGTLQTGDAFGEGPLFGKHFASASLVSESPCQLLQIPLARIRADETQLTAFKESLHALFRQRLVQATLLRVPFLAGLSDEERGQIADELLMRDVRRGEYVVRRGNKPNGLHLILDGEFVIENDGHVLSHLDEGDFFGATALMTNALALEDIRALTPCTVLTMPTLQFLGLLETHPGLADAINAVITQRNQYGARIQLLGDALVAHGVRRGEQLLVRAYDKCPPGCRACVDGCGQRHGTPRLRLSGVRTDTIEIVDHCRQCRFGAECVEHCPENAIVRTGTVWSISDACTGCGACVPACPYDAIHRSYPDQRPLARLHQRIATIPLVQNIIAPPRAVAAKCDFCVGYGTHACVAACPHDALHVVPVEQLFPY